MRTPSPLSRCLLPTTLALACASAFAADIDHAVVQRAQSDGSADVLIVLADKAPKQLLRRDGDYLERRRALVDLLRVHADVSQAPLRAWLTAQGIEHRAYWINNTIQARVSAGQLAGLAAFDGVARVASNAPIAMKQPEAASPAALLPDAARAATWGVTKIRAPQVWAAGIKGQGVVVAGQDTGYRWSHEAIKSRYRGWNGTTADHNYSWHDAIHSGGGSCGANSVVSCDDQGHGTHTMGTIVGDNGAAEQVGVAPDAKWIGCRNMDVGNGTPATYIECTQWFIAPTDLAGNNPNPDLAPDVVNNSWGCVVEEGCTTGQEIREAIDNIVNAGILFVVAAGNDGSTCGTIADAPAMYDVSFTVGSTTSAGAVSGFSSRGPVAGLATDRKPDVIAPGSAVRSSTRTSDTSYGNNSGTSMASPHVAGAAALVMSTNPSLRGNPAVVSAILRQTAVPLTTSTQVCGGIPATTFPNPVQGHGEIDVYGAFLVAEKIFANGFDGG